MRRRLYQLSYPSYSPTTAARARRLLASGVSRLPPKAAASECPPAAFHSALAALSDTTVGVNPRYPQGRPGGHCAVGSRPC
jgi:hypothetical protein